MNWDGLFGLHVTATELAVRGTVIYWFLFLIFRFILRRDIGALGLADVLLLVIVADAAQNAMAGGYQTVTEGCILVGVIVFWNGLLDWLAYRYAWAARLAEAPPLLLVRNGVIQHRNLRKQLLTVEELKAQFRQQGIEELRQVKSAWMEGDGHISVIRRH